MIDRRLADRYRASQFTAGCSRFLDPGELILSSVRSGFELISAGGTPSASFVFNRLRADWSCKLLERKDLGASDLKIRDLQEALIQRWCLLKDDARLGSPEKWLP